MSTPLGPILSMWEAEGNRHATAFDACAGAVVIGEQPTVAAEVALGIARVQARRRRVAVADTVGELGPLEDLVPMDAPYGLVDSFFYGVSLNKIAYTVDPAKNLIIFPSGAVPIDHEALLGSDRWVKLLEAFRAADGLLLIVAPAESSALSSLIQVMDGVALVGNVAAAPGTRVLAHARLPIIPARPTPPSLSPIASVSGSQPSRAPTATRTPFPPPPAYTPLSQAPAAPPPAPSTQPQAARTSVREDREPDAVDRVRADAHASASEAQESVDESAEGESHVVAEEGPALVPPWACDGEPADSTHAPIGGAKTVTFWVAIVAGALVAAALLTWVTSSMRSRRGDADAFATRPDSAQGAAHVIAAPAPTALAPRRDSATRVTAATAAPAAAADTITAPFSVVLADVSSMTGANGELDQASGREFPAVTFSPYRRPNGNMSYVVISGAFPDSAAADALLREVRAKKYRTAAAAHVVKLPYAVLIQKGVSQDQAPMFVHAYLSKGLPVYSLVQKDGTASLWAGAFRSVEQAEPLVTSFRANGDQPTVMIRTGRSF
jgi:SPOR domain